MATWTITVHKVFSHRIGVDIYASFSVQVSPAFKSVPKRRTDDHHPDAGSRSTLPELECTTQLLANPDAMPNCTWNPSPTKTVSKAGLCDDAVLSYGAR